MFLGLWEHESAEQSVGIIALDGSKGHKKGEYNEDINIKQP